MSKAYKPRRSVLYVPGDNPRALEKARGLDTDCYILDLEDAIAPDAKDAARQAACAAIPGFAPREVVLRINHPASAWAKDDFAAAVAAKPDAILLPKIHDAEDVIAAHAMARGIPLWVMIETCRAVMNLGEIAGAGTAVLVLGSNDLLKEMGGLHVADRANLQAAMALCVTAGRAHGVAVLDGVHNDIADEAGFALACRQARDFGFDGKTVIHPVQIGPANAAFTPSAEEVAAARRILEAFAQNPGKGVIALDGRMVEKLDADIARRILARAGC